MKTYTDALGMTIVELYYAKGEELAVEVFSFFPLEEANKGIGWSEANRKLRFEYGMLSSYAGDPAIRDGAIAADRLPDQDFEREEPKKLADFPVSTAYRALSEKEFAAALAKQPVLPIDEDTA